MAKDENDLADLFAAALEDESKKPKAARPKTGGAPSSSKSSLAPKPPAPSGGSKTGSTSSSIPIPIKPASGGATKSSIPIRGGTPRLLDDDEPPRPTPAPPPPKPRAPIPAPSTRAREGEATGSSTPLGSISGSMARAPTVATLPPAPSKTPKANSSPPPMAAHPPPAPPSPRSIAPKPGSTRPVASSGKTNPGLTVLPRSSDAPAGGSVRSHATGSLPPTSMSELRGSLAPRSVPSSIRGKPAAELDSNAEQIDHKGRSKPIFAPRSPRPQTKRVHPVIDLLAGLVPGGRWMARERAASGLGYALVGVIALLPAIVVLIGWGAREAVVDKLMIERVWLSAHAGVVVVSVLLYELIRSGASLDPHRRHIAVARFVAALTVPALLVLAWGPSLVKDAPSYVEPAWFLAIPAVFAGLVATAEVFGRGHDGATSHKAALVTGATLLGGALVGLLVLTMSLDLRASLERTAVEAGFVRLPELLRALRLG